jgi:hypothetical protein
MKHLSHVRDDDKVPLDDARNDVIAAATWASAWLRDNNDRTIACVRRGSRLLRGLMTLAELGTVKLTFLGPPAARRKQWVYVEARRVTR